MTNMSKDEVNAFLDKARRYAGKIPFTKDLMAMYYCMEDIETPWGIKLAIAGCVGYVLNPADPFAPDPAVFADDGAAIMGTLRLAGSFITKKHREKAMHFFGQEVMNP